MILQRPYSYFHRSFYNLSKYIYVKNENKNKKMCKMNKRKRMQNKNYGLSCLTLGFWLCLIRIYVCMKTKTE